MSQLITKLKSNQLPPEVMLNFSDKPLSNPNKEQLEKANHNLIKIQCEDYQWRVDNRGKFGWWIFGLLIGQNVLIFSFIFFAFFKDALGDIQWLVGSFFAGLMTQTYFTANYLVKWLFTDINYKLHKI